MIEEIDVLKEARKEGFVKVEKAGRLDEWDIYDPIYSEEGMAYIGLPIFVGTNGQKIKWFIGKEAFDVIHRLHLDQEDEEDS